MSKHTPEPWRVHFYNENVGYGIAAGPDIPTQWPDKMVVEFGGTQDGDSQGVISKENAERVVACVNACKGLPDPGVVPEIVAVLRECETDDGASSLCREDMTGLERARRRLHAINDLVRPLIERLDKAGV
jgi:hypothetical protein